MLNMTIAMVSAIKVTVAQKREDEASYQDDEALYQAARFMGRSSG
jgi:hypothetical protein